MEDHNRYISQQLFMSCRTDAVYNATNRSWNKLGSFIVVANFCKSTLGPTPTLSHQILTSIAYPKDQSYFMEKYSNLYKCTPVHKSNSFFQPTHIFVHEGEIYRIEVCKVDKRWLASSSDTENICLWDIIK